MRRSAHCPRDEYNGTICAAVRFSVAAITVATCSNVMEGFLLFCFFCTSVSKSWTNIDFSIPDLPLIVRSLIRC